MRRVAGDVLTDRDEWNALCAQRVAQVEEVVEGGRQGSARAGQDALVVPEHIGTVDVHGHGPQVAVSLRDGEELLGHGGTPALALVQEVDRLHTAGLDVAVEQLVTEVYLERIGRLTSQEARLQDGLHIAASAGAARDSGVHDVDVRVAGLERGIQRVECLNLAR